MKLTGHYHELLIPQIFLLKSPSNIFLLLLKLSKVFLILVSDLCYCVVNFGASQTNFIPELLEECTSSRTDK